jgi:hypothetical protein
MRVLTRGRSGRFVLIATLLGMVVALAIVLPPGDATGQVPAKAEVDAGLILMSTGPEAGDNWVRYYAEPIAPLDVDAYDAHQAIDISRRVMSRPTIHSSPFPKAVGNTASVW